MTDQQRDFTRTIRDLDHHPAVTLHHGDALDFLRAMPGASVDALITDPPYGYGLMEWDEPIDASVFFCEAARVVRRDGFVAFFGQLPSALTWLTACGEAGLDMLEHVVWAKRIATPMHRLTRAHESIWIYGRDRRRFFNTDGPYEDVKLPGLLTATVTIDGIDRYIKDLRAKAEGRHAGPRPRSPGVCGHGTDKYRGGAPHDRSRSTANFSTIWSFLSPAQSQITNKEFRHPTEKPAAALDRLVEMLVRPGGVVFDPFMGSGTTGAAAIRHGCEFIGAENNAEYFDTALRRIRAERQAPTLFSAVQDDPEEAA